jgi:prophage regulatory protein
MEKAMTMNAKKPAWSPPTVDQLRLLTLKQTAGLTTFSRHQVQLLVRQGLFPPPIQLSPRRIGFIEAEVLSWLQERKRQRTTPVAWQSIADGNEVSATA